MVQAAQLPMSERSVPNLQCDISRESRFGNKPKIRGRGPFRELTRGRGLFLVELREGFVSDRICDVALPYELKKSRVRRNDDFVARNIHARNRPFRTIALRLCDNDAQNVVFWLAEFRYI
jgi:hypothetical protein